MTRGRRARAILGLAAAVALPACRATFVRRAPKESHPGVVTLIAASGALRHHVGTGFFVASGVLVTAHHVVRGTAFIGAGGASIPTLLAQSEDGTRRLVVGVRGDSAERDVVALTVKDSESLPSLPLEPELPRVGSPVVVVGYTTSLRIEPGRVMTDRWMREPEWDTCFDATCSVAGGHSGSPVFDAAGQVVGVAIRGGDGHVTAQGAAVIPTLVAAPERRWDVWCLAERDDADEEAAAHIDQGEIASHRDPSSASRRFRRAIELAEDDGVLRNAVEKECACLAKDGGAEEAARRAERVLEANPRCAWAEKLLGVYRLAAGDVSGYEHLATASVLRPDDPSPVLAAAEWSLKARPAPDFLPALRRVVQSQPGRVRAWAILGRIASDRGEHEESARAWERVADARPDDADAFTAWAFELEELARHDEARDAVEAALRNDPKDKRARYARVVVLLGCLDRDGARRAFDELHAEFPEYASPLEPFLLPPVPAEPGRAR